MTDSIWEHFTIEELQCPCCGKMEMNHAFMNEVVELRKEADFPFPVNSGYRCPQYNSTLSSTGPTGPHTTGRALDIGVSGNRAHRLVELAMRRGFTGIGIKQHGAHGKRFVHIDNLSGHDTQGKRPWIWSYT